jgi:glycolate oxidase FAD binding subunit
VNTALQSLVADTEDDLRQTVAQAAESHTPLRLRGAGTKQGMLGPVQEARTVSTLGHAGISLYSPKELVISLRAGTTVATAESALAEFGQHLISEPPDLSGLLGTSGAQTIGGLVAANLSGPRRVAWGATRDHVLGIRAIDGRAQVIRSGGRVLKNVTGLDLCKLLTGSHGTLGLITEITFKVLPAPESTGSVVLTGLDPARAVAALSAALGSPWSVSAAAYLPADAAARLGFPDTATLCRIEDFAQFTAYRLGRLRDHLAPLGPADLLDDEESRRVWRAVRDASPLPVTPQDAIWRVSVRPSAGPLVAETLSRQLGARYFLDWGGGLVWLAAPHSEAAHDAVCAAARASTGTWMLLRAPSVLRTQVAVIPPEPPPLAAIAARVKHALDPHGIFNPGRLHAGA